MGKAGNCIKMLTVLSDGRLHKIEELSMILETEKRNIIEYKKELEMAGYYIEGVTGRNGGYRLEVDKVFIAPKLTENERKALEEAKVLAMSNESFNDNNDLISAVSKVLSNNLH